MTAPALRWFRGCPGPAGRDNPPSADIVQTVDESPAPVNLTRRIITSAVLVVAALFVAQFGFKRLASLREDSARTEGGVLAPLVRAERAKRLDYTETLRGYGRAEPLRRSTVVAEVAGVVRTIAPTLEPGTAIQTVTDPSTENGGSGAKGALPVLVTLDARDFEDRIESARAEVKAVEAEIARLGAVGATLEERVPIAEEELDAAQRELRRIAGLVPKTLTESDLDKQKLQVTVRRSNLLALVSLVNENDQAVAAAKARLVGRNKAVQLAVREKERTVIRAPFAGRVAMRHVNLGERVRIGDPLFTIVDLTRMQIPVALPAGRYDEVALDAAARVKLPDHDDYLWEGTLDRIAPQINTQERTFFAFVVVPGSAIQTTAPPGTHVIAEVQGKTHERVIAVPRRAFLGTRMFVAKKAEGEEYVIEERQPAVSRYLSGVALVTNGIEDGELFLVTNLEAVAAGSRVRLAEGEGAK